MNINGYDIVKGKRDVKRWAKEHLVFDGSLPESYPAIITERNGADENAYLVFYTEETLWQMLDAVRTAKTQKSPNHK